MGKTRKFFVIGASFSNKGAEAMIFIMVNELRKKYPGCEIYLPNVAVGDDAYRFTGVYVDERSHEYLKGGWHKVRALGEMLARKIIKHKGQVSDIKKLKEVFSEVDAVFDISGYNLSNRWDYAINHSYLRYIEEARKFGVPVYLMPQSFGPFDYKGEMAAFDGRIREVLPYPRMIFCREEDGFQTLAEKYGLHNLYQSTDIVLQAKEISVDAVMAKKKDRTLPKIQAGSVGLLPNFMNLKYMSQEDMVTMYASLISFLNEKGKHVYLMRHSKVDADLCRAIYEATKNEKVHLLNEEFRCYEFSDIVTKFDFLVASRFHSIVHAFREGVPCIAIGWSVKYQNLLRLVGQEKYLFDIRSIEEDAMKNAMQNLLDHREASSVLIRSHVRKIQENTCFDQLFEDLDRVLKS